MRYRVIKLTLQQLFFKCEWQLWTFSNDDFPQNQPTKLSATDIRVNKAASQIKKLGHN